MLKANKNSLTEVNESMIEWMPYLQKLDLSYNKIGFVTTLIQKWSESLMILKLDHNLLSEVPNEITKLYKLKYLKVS